MALKFLSFCLKGFDVTNEDACIEVEDMIDEIKKYGGEIHDRIIDMETDYIIWFDSTKLPHDVDDDIKNDTGCTPILSLIDFYAFMQKKMNENIITCENKTRVEKEQKEDEAYHNSLKKLKAAAEEYDNDLLLVDRYAPKSSLEIIGNYTTVKALKKWFEGWKVPKKERANKHFKGAVLISGPPGIGKTTLAHLIAKESGFTNIIECNASDVRGKEDVHELLKDFGRTMTMGTDGFIVVEEDVKQSCCVIMDEVDGMAGGGITSLSNIIKKQRGPIVCICNEKYASCLKTLKLLCLCLDVYRPSVDECFPRIKKIVVDLGLRLTDEMIRKIIVECNGDIRSMINMIQLNLSLCMTTFEEVEKSLNDVSFSPFESIKKVFGSKLSLEERFKFHWYNNDLMPAFMQQNYLESSSCSSSLTKMADAADSISIGDTFETMIYKTQHWELAESHALFATVCPSFILSSSRQNHSLVRVSFPESLGKGSTLKRHQRILDELKHKIGDDSSLELCYYYSIFTNETNNNNVENIVDLLISYGLDLDDFNYIIDNVPIPTNNKKMIPTKTKSAITRLFNKKSKTTN